MKEQSTLSIEATATEGQWLYERDALLKIREFRDSHIGVDVTITFASHDDPEHWQYKYLYGYVYYAIAQGMGIPTTAREGADNKNDSGIDEIDRVLKEQLLFTEVKSEKEIPRKWRRKCQTLYVDYKTDIGEVKRQIYGVIPSKTVLGYDGLAKFIKECEMYRDGLTDWQYKNPAEMARVRALAFGEVA